MRLAEIPARGDGLWVERILPKMKSDDYGHTGLFERRVDNSASIPPKRLPGLVGNSRRRTVDSFRLGRCIRVGERAILRLWREGDRGPFPIVIFTHWGGHEDSVKEIIGRAFARVERDLRESALAWPFTRAEPDTILPILVAEALETGIRLFPAPAIVDPVLLSTVDHGVYTLISQRRSKAPGGGLQTPGRRAKKPRCSHVPESHLPPARRNVSLGKGKVPGRQARHEEKLDHGSGRLARKGSHSFIRSAPVGIRTEGANPMRSEPPNEPGSARPVRTKTLRGF